MDRKRLDEWCEKGILALAACVLVAGPLALGAVTTRGFLLLEALTLGIMLLWAARLWVSPRPQFLFPPICWSVLAFTAYAIARYFQADVEYSARLEIEHILVYAFLFFAVLNNLHRQESMQTLSLAVIFLGMLISVYALYQYATGSFRVWSFAGLYPGRATGTYMSPNDLAGFLEMLVPLALAYVLAGRMSHVAKVFVGYAALVMLAGIGVTLSRGGYAATMLSLLVLCAVLLGQRGYRLQALALSGALILAGIFVAPKIQQAEERSQRNIANASPSDLANDMRVSIWRAGYAMWRDHVWWGTGPGQFDENFRRYRPLDVQRRPGWAHNDYLNTLTDYGVTGGVLVASALVFLGAGIVRTWKHLRGDQNEFTRPKGNRFAFLVGASVSLVALLAHSFVDFNMHIPANAILTVTFMALLSSQLRFVTEGYWFAAGAAARTAVTAVLIAAAGALGCAGWRAAAEDVPLRQAEKIPTSSPSARVPWLEAALAIEPSNSETAFQAGEAWRLISFLGNTNYESAASNAMSWFARGMKSNPHDEQNWRGYGICLDWIRKTNEAGAYFQHADDLDPNGYFTSAWIGWHYIQLQDFAGARVWLERSRRLEWSDANQIAITYLDVADNEMRRAASRFAPATPSKTE